MFKNLRKSQGFTLIKLLIVIIIIGILAAIAIPMFLSQRDKAKEASVKEAVHTLQIGIQSYAVDNEDLYPAGADEIDIGPSAAVAYVDIWPHNPWEGTAMDSSGSQGNFSYEVIGDKYELVGYGKSAAVIIASP